MTMTEAATLVAGRYRIVRALGAGGMGRVWLARDEVLRRDVAIKEIVLPFGLPDPEREELRLRTLREARAAARLSHPNVVQIYDVQSGDERPWIVMEYVHSRSLLQVIEESGALPVEQVAGIGLAVLSALDAANRVGVLHRDVKPSNVLIADDGRVVLTDFGSAMIDETDGAITRTGVILGSPQYIAPERIDTGVSTPEADLWSLGATLYAAVEGRPPYTRTTTLRSLIAITSERPDPTRLAGPLKPVLTGLLQHNPHARMKPAEVERRLRRLADVQTTVHLRTVPQPQAPAEPAAAPPPAVEAAREGDPRPLPVPRPRQAPEPRERPPLSVPSAGAARAVAGARRHWRVVAAGAVAAVVLPLAVAVGTGHPAVFSRDERRIAATSAAQPPVAPTRAAVSPSAAPAPPFVLPARFAWWRDRTGYQVGWPAKWSRQREGPLVMFFCAPGGPPTLRVKVWQGAGPNLDLLVALVRNEQKARLPAYHRIRIEATPGAADRDTVWEYEFTDPKAGRLHAVEHAFVAGGRTFLIQWRAPVAKWTASLADLAVVRASFRPGTGT
jgi:eukaryotic-like serine/threonine-protein kinase